MPEPHPVVRSPVSRFAMTNVTGSTREPVNGPIHCGRAAVPLRLIAIANHLGRIDDVSAAGRARRRPCTGRSFPGADLTAKKRGPFQTVPVIARAIADRLE